MTHDHMEPEKPEKTSSKAVEFAWLLFFLIIMLIPFAVLKPYMGHFYNAVYVAGFCLGFFWSKHIYPTLRNAYKHPKSHYYALRILIAVLILSVAFLLQIYVRFWLEVL